MKAFHDPLQAALEMRSQLASDERRLALFCGAGTSMAVGLPGIVALTKNVQDNLKEPYKALFKGILAELAAPANVEDALNRIRIFRELIGNDKNREYSGIKGNEVARALDIAVCQAISSAVRIPAPGGLGPHITLAHWLRALHGRRPWPVEIFTTNYDLYLEQAMEAAGVPFFDGFVGAVEPFFAPECIEAEGMASDAHVYPCRAWTRLWKMHGSVSWRVKPGASQPAGNIRRFSGVDGSGGEELAVFPSRDKYSQSRKLPFVSLQDRFRRFLCSGDRLLIIIGYSFSDEHLNEIILQGLRSNPHLAVTALTYGEPVEAGGKKALRLPSEVSEYGREYRNLTVLGPDAACIGGILAPWKNNAGDKEPRGASPFWSEKEERFTLGDFTQLASYLELFIGFRPTQSVPVEPVASAGEHSK